MAASSSRVSIVVPTFNRYDKLARLLSSLDKLHADCLVDVIVVDDFSTDETATVIEGWLGRPHQFEPRYLRMGQKGGPAKARNLGLKEAEGNVVAFTDDDCVVHEKWLINLVDPLDAERHVIGVGGSVLPLNNDVVSLYYTFHHILEPPPSLLYLVTANCCYVRTQALAAGGFDEDLPMPGGEDVALSFSLYKEVYRFAMAKNAVVYHDYRRDLRDFYRTFLNYGTGCRYVTDKHFGNGAVRNDQAANLW